MAVDLAPSTCTPLDLEALVCIDGSGTTGVLVCSPRVICGQHVCGEAVPAIPPILAVLPPCDDLALAAAASFALDLAPAVASALDLQPLECG
jgi:hypothetical protein